MACTAPRLGTGRRVLLIDSIDDLNRNAENAMLKVLEEPLPGTVILLVCHSPGSVPRTILSRCAQMPMRPPPLTIGDQILLASRPDWPQDQRTALLALADGAPGLALEYGSFELLGHYEHLLDAMSASGDSTALAFKQAELMTKLAGDKGVRIPFELLAQFARRTARVMAGSGSWP